jgi:hypothetical protein
LVWLEFVWNVNLCFVLISGILGPQQLGFQSLAQMPVPRKPSPTGPFTTANATRNLWCRRPNTDSDNFAIQGQAGFNYVDNVRAYSGSNAFGNSGEFAVFTIAPTIKPKGGYFTRPEIRVFATYSIWSSSLKGTVTPTGEGGNTTNPSNPPYNGNSNQGWLIGSQLEIWF